jgi:argininosuccinate lyase
MASLMLSNIQVKENILSAEKYKYLFSVEEVNKLVLSGMPFRDAYKKVGQDIEKGKFNYQPQVNHTHEGSIGNLCNDKIKTNFENVLSKFNFSKAKTALSKLIEDN